MQWTMTCAKVLGRIGIATCWPLGCVNYVPGTGSVLFLRWVVASYLFFICKAMVVKRHTLYRNGALSLKAIVVLPCFSWLPLRWRANCSGPWPLGTPRCTGPVAEGGALSGQNLASGFQSPGTALAAWGGGFSLAPQDSARRRLPKLWRGSLGLAFARLLVRFWRKLVT